MINGNNQITFESTTINIKNAERLNIRKLKTDIFILNLSPEYNYNLCIFKSLNKFK